MLDRIIAASIPHDISFETFGYSNAIYSNEMLIYLLKDFAIMIVGAFKCANRFRIVSSWAFPIHFLRCLSRPQENQQ